MDKVSPKTVKMTIEDEETRKPEKSSETFLLQKETAAAQRDMKLKKCWGSSRQLKIDVLAGVFGISAWLSVNALYTQLPILVQTAPEGWSLPSYLSVAIQLANIGPILYSLSQKCPRMLHDSKLIYFALLLGMVSLVLMGLYYNVTLIIFRISGSVVLWILAFCVALVGCTSSVLFIPFMNHYAEIHLISYMVGEGLGGFFPSIISLVQGVGGNPSCKNTTTPTGEIVITSYYPSPNFSITTFFTIMCGFMAASTIAFIMLNNLESCKRQKIKKPRLENGETEPSFPPRVVVYQEPETFIFSQETFSPKTLLVLTAILSAFSNGALPSIQSYSCLPYGNVAYHLAVNLCNMANPAACFIAYFVPIISKKCTCLLVFLSGVSVMYVFLTASLSPHPPLQDSTSGVFLIVLSWVVCFGSISYVKMSIAGILRKRGGRGLFRYGAMTQVGAFLGSVVTFMLINTFQLFTSYNPCS